MGNQFSFEQIPDLSNKVYVITGANTGIGYVTALEIARRNGNVIMCCRSEERAKDAISRIEQDFQTCKLDKYGKVDFIQLDLMSLKSVEASARAIIKKYPKIDCLINNAGISGPPFQVTVDKIESQFATNHMGHFLFTMLLIPTLMKSETARIVNVSSDAHYFTYSSGILTIDQLLVPATESQEKSLAEKKYKRTLAYGSSKLANILFTKYLAQHIPRIKSYAVHPGLVKTEIDRSLHDSPVGRKLIHTMWIVFGKTAAQGSVTTLRAATDPLLDTEQGVKVAPSGTYFVPQGKPQVPSKHACNPEMAQRLFDLSISICLKVMGEQVTNEINTNWKLAAPAK